VVGVGFICELGRSSKSRIEATARVYSWQNFEDREADALRSMARANTIAAIDSISVAIGNPQ
jgi:hypothetical protein